MHCGKRQDPAHCLCPNSLSARKSKSELRWHEEMPQNCSISNVSHSTTTWGQKCPATASKHTAFQTFWRVQPTHSLRNPYIRYASIGSRTRHARPIHCFWQRILIPRYEDGNIWFNDFTNKHAWNQYPQSANDLIIIIRVFEVHVPGSLVRTIAKHIPELDLLVSDFLQMRSVRPKNQSVHGNLMLLLDERSPGAKSIVAHVHEQAGLRHAVSDSILTKYKLQKKRL